MIDPGNTGGGYSTVRRELGVLTATSIVVANIIGSGIFVTSGILAGFLPGSSWVLICWVFGGMISLAGALCYAELATRMPEEGGEYVYLRELYHPLFGFLTGWTSFVVGFTAAIAASAMGFSEYLYEGLNGGLISLSPGWLTASKKGTAILIVLLFTALHYRGIRTGSKVQNLLTVVKVLIVLGIAGAGLAAGGGDWKNIASGGNAGFGWTGVGTAMMLIMFSYSGWNASAYIAGELRDPKRTLKVSLVTGTVIVVVLYLALNLFIFKSLEFSEAAGIVPIVEKASVRAFGPWMGRGLSVMISLALLSSLSAFILIGPRVYFAMARDRLFFPFASAVHERYGVPSRSIAIQGGLASIMVLAGSFEQLLVYLGFALGIFPWMAVAGIFIARRRGVGEGGAVRVPGYPLVPLFFLVSTLALMVVAYIGRPVESTAAVATVLAGIPCYLIWIRVVMNGRSGSRP